jgi:predicted HAD superfamily Cof-like phosphohydrolase
MSIESINLWHKRARPEPKAEDFSVQVGCHLEEIVEMFEVLSVKDSDSDEVSYKAWEALLDLAGGLKSGRLQAAINDGERAAFLDSLADQVVTAVGVGHCAGMRVPQAVSRVDRSNWSKFDADGQPLFDENGKIKKGPNYAKPDLEGLY